MNMVVIDLGEAIKYPSHPELAVKGFMTAPLEVPHFFGHESEYAPVNKG